MNKSLALIPILLATWLGEGPAAAQPRSKVAWNGDSFLDVTYKQVDGRDICLDIYFPSVKPEGAPLLYYVHGGGWAAGSKSHRGLPRMRLVFELLAQRGCVCVSIDYRLCKKNSGVVMRDCVTDAMDGLRFLKKQADRYGIDPNRIVVWGDSAGGQIAQMLTYASPAAFPGDSSLASYDVRPVAGMSWYGPTDFTDIDLFRTGASEKNPDRFGARIAGNGGGHEQNANAFREMSPYYWIAKKSPPLLLLQGDRDTTIPLAHATHLKTKADQMEADVTLIVVKNAGHNWRNAGGAPAPGMKEIQRITAEWAWKQLEAAATHAEQLTTIE